jgi:hypothetical protein
MRLVREIDLDDDAMDHRQSGSTAEDQDAVDLDPADATDAVDPVGEAPDGQVSDEAAEPAPDADHRRSGSAEVDLRTIEALLFSTHHPLTAGRLAELLGLDSTKPIRGAVRQLNRDYGASGRAFRIEQVAGGRVERVVVGGNADDRSRRHHALPPSSPPGGHRPDSIRRWPVTEPLYT